MDRLSVEARLGRGFGRDQIEGNQARGKSDWGGEEVGGRERRWVAEGGCLEVVKVQLVGDGDHENVAQLGHDHPRVFL